VRSGRRVSVLSLMIAACAACVASSGCEAQQRPATREPSRKETKVLIVYLSRTNNTKAVAEIIQQAVEGTIVPLEVERPYPTDYNATVQQVARENEIGYLPRLKTKIDNIEQYDVVFLGFPTWGMQLPPPMKSFLREHNLSGKTVVPFNTNAGYGEGSSFEDVKRLCQECSVLEGFVTRGGEERRGLGLAIHGERADEVRRGVEKWLKRLGIARRND